MTSFAVYRLEPRSPFHFGEHGIGVEETAETFRSDSLFAALCTSIREGWGTDRLVKLLEGFQSPSPPFRLSSCFPYAGEILFLPRPMLAPPIDPLADVGKRLKHTRFISREIFSRWMVGEDLSDEAGGDRFLSEDRAWLSHAERARLASGESELVEAVGRDEPLWWRGDVPRVTIDRQTSASTVYRSGRMVFRRGCGLYFLAEWLDDSARPLVEQALVVLGDAGLGGRRSSGHGQFTPQPMASMELADVSSPDAWITLSLYWPTPADLHAGVLAEPARYDILNRRGWVTSPDAGALRRRAVRMLVEGSVLAAANERGGGLADVTPAGFTAHRVYRYGLAFPVPVRLREVRRG